MLEPAIFIKEHDPSNKVFLTMLFQCMTHDFLKNSEAVDKMLNLMQKPSISAIKRGFFVRQAMRLGHLMH
jgi:hypothetical protein